MGRRVELIIHLEPTDDEIVWWGESPEVEGFSAAAPTLAELRQRAIEALSGTFGADVQLIERLVGGELQQTRGDADRVVLTDLIPS